MTVTIKKFNCVESFDKIRLFDYCTLWFCEDMVLIVSLCQFYCYRTTSHIPMAMNK